MSFGEDASGELYVAVAGTVYRIDSDAPIAAVPALGKSRLVWLWFGLVLLASARGRARVASTG